MSGAADIQTGWRFYNGKKYFFSVNMSHSTETVTLSTTGLNAAQTLNVDGENRSVTLQNGKLTDTFKPFELHVYTV